MICFPWIWYKEPGVFCLSVSDRCVNWAISECCTYVQLHVLVRASRQEFDHSFVFPRWGLHTSLKNFTLHWVFTCQCMYLQRLIVKVINLGPKYLAISLSINQLARWYPGDIAKDDFFFWCHDVMMKWESPNDVLKQLPPILFGTLGGLGILPHYNHQPLPHPWSKQVVFH